VLHGGDTVPFYGEHQAGIATTPPQSSTTLVALALALRPETDRDALRRMMRLLTTPLASPAVRRRSRTPSLSWPWCPPASR